MSETTELKGAKRRLIATPAPSAPGEGPGHYRLSTETWLVILREYVEGATVRELSMKWRVSEHAVRKRITQHGATKREWGDRAAAAQAKAREEAVRIARENSPEARAARLFDERPDDPPELADPEFLGRVAVLASGRAMGDQLWTEAKMLTSLAESYGRLTVRRERAALTLDTIPLELVAEIAVGAEDGWLGRMNLSHVRDDDPENPIRDWFWQKRAAREQARKAERDEAYRRGVDFGRQNPEPA